MSKEKVQKLTKYVSDLNNRLSSTTLPAKQVNRPDSYKQFLQKEIKMASVKLESLKMSEPAKK